MKHSVVVLLLVLFSANLFAQHYGMDNASNSLFTKFRVPETDLRSIRLNAGLNFTSNKTTYSYPSESGNKLNTLFQYSLSPQFYLLKESDDRTFSLNLAADGSYQRQYSRDQNSYKYVSPVGSPNFTEYERKTIASEVTLRADAAYRNYFLHDNIYYISRFNSQVTLGDNYVSQSPNQDKQYTGTKSQEYLFSLGIGWGKYRNVTPVVSAIRFQERLKQLNLLNNNLSDKTIEDLAEHFSKQNYYSQVHDRPDKYFWQEIEKILVNDNVLPISSLNQYANSYLREIPFELRFLRNEGLITEIDLQLDYVNQYYSHVNYFYPEAFYVLANAYLEYSHQMDLNSQISFGLSLSGGPNITEKPLVKQKYLLTSKLGYDFELTDRIVTSLNDSFSLLFQNSALQGKILSNNLTIKVNYFLEDKLALGASYNWEYTENRDINTFQYSSTGSYNYVSFGLTYFLDRGFLTI
ncbi:MAG: hypothetical protein ACM3S2_19870 [Ignavibacteriales bacterium]